jgi:hypothetical protein
MQIIRPKSIKLGVTTARKVLPLASRLMKKPGNEVGSKVPPRDQKQHAQFAEYGAVYMILLCRDKMCSKIILMY